MEKGKLGIKVSFLAALMFFVAYFSGFVWAIVIAVAFVLIEKNDWLTKQAVQAIIYALAFSVAVAVVSFVRDLAFMPSFLSSIFSYLYNAIDLVDILVLVLAVLAVIKGNDANLPIIGDCADSVLGIVKEKAAVAVEAVAQPEEQTTEETKEPANVD